MRRVHITLIDTVNWCNINNVRSFDWPATWQPLERIIKLTDIDRERLRAFLGCELPSYDGVIEIIESGKYLAVQNTYDLLPVTNALIIWRY